MTVSHAFVDPISGREVFLSFTTDDPSWWDGTAGVAHGVCDRLADVSADLDAFYCPDCKWSGRISGVWAVDMIRQARHPHTRSEA